jgi:hypothetical protein
MGWRWRKSIGLGGGARTTISKSGLGFSYGYGGLRIGRSPSGGLWVSATIPGTGISFFKSLSRNTNSQTIAQPVPIQHQPINSTTSGQPVSLQTPNQLLLEKMKKLKP